MATVPIDLGALILYSQNDNGGDPVHVKNAQDTASRWLASKSLTAPVATQIVAASTPTPAAPATTPAPTTSPSTPATAPASATTWTKPYWLGEWSGNVQDTVKSIIAAAGSNTALLVAYNIPGRDNGNYSAGGLHSADEYNAWIKAIAAGIGSAKALVVLEPDALGLSRSLSDTVKQARYAMLQNAITTLKANANTKVYVDSSIWAGVSDSVNLLGKLKGMDGFSCNVSGYLDLNTCINYATAVANASGLRYIIDTSRNGNGAPHGSDIWCNQTDTKIGTPNTANPLGSTSKCDAYIWVKVPDESDGKKINGKDGDGKPEIAPSAGTYWPEWSAAIRSGDWTAFKAKYNV